MNDRDNRDAEPSLGLPGDNASVAPATVPPSMPPATQISVPPAPEDARRATPNGVALPLPTPDQVLGVVLQLARVVSLEMRDEELVHAHVDALKALFPRRLFAIRLVSPTSGRLALAYATERIREEHLLVPAVSRQAIERHRLSPDVTPHRGIRIIETYSPILKNSIGFDVPMMDGDRMVGVLSVDYPPGITEFAEDQPIIAQVALQLGAALRNARLLRESLYLRDYLSKLLENANAPIAVLGTGRQVRVVNRAFLHLTGLARTDVIGVDIIDLLAETERPRMLGVFARALAGETTSDAEVRLQHRDGSVARIALNTVAIQNQEKAIEGVLVIGRDLTEVRRLEEQILQAERLATVGQLAAGVVHELNNPLTSIAVYSDYLLKKLDGAEFASGDLEKLRRISQAAERIRRFTQDLGIYGRPTREQPEWLSLRDIVEQSVVFCEHLLAECGTTVEKIYGPSLPEAFAVREQLHQVFINLITNACHAMPEGAGRLVVEVFSDDTSVCARIRDNGVGIPPDVIDRVFEPFFSTKGEGKGTGLGLSIVRNIVRQHRGEVLVTSDVGRGTTFEVRLPRQPREATK